MKGGSKPSNAACGSGRTGARGERSTVDRGGRGSFLQRRGPRSVRVAATGAGGLRLNWRPRCPGGSAALAAKADVHGEAPLE
jgi:hypothetical protein